MPNFTAISGFYRPPKIRTLNKLGSRALLRFAHIIHIMITVISSTNRPESHTLKLSQYYQRKLKEAGEDAGLLSLTDLPPNVIQADMYKNAADDFKPIQDIITASDKFVFVVPEYNGSFPGVLKVLIDACKYPDSFFGKKAALVGLSSGKYGNIRGIDHLTGICHYINLHVLPMRIHIPAIDKEFDESGNLFKPDTVKFTDEQIRRFLSF
ncbi:MAG: NAD(P)H-dependent oxidoreductase [Sphingobacteriaceae bacterium]|nr:NAD(P)H-dependent oxidoreductase [Sphingobacteriaceae bacterium]